MKNWQYILILFLLFGCNNRKIFYGYTVNEIVFIPEFCYVNSNYNSNFYYDMDGRIMCLLLVPKHIKKIYFYQNGVIYTKEEVEILVEKINFNKRKYK